VSFSAREVHSSSGIISIPFSPMAAARHSARCLPFYALAEAAVVMVTMWMWMGFVPAAEAHSAPPSVLER